MSNEPPLRAIAKLEIVDGVRHWRALLKKDNVIVWKGQPRRYEDMAWAEAHIKREELNEKDNRC